MLGGEVSGRSILCPGPDHSSRDRSLSVLFSTAAPDGFIVRSHAGDNDLDAKDYVRQRLGLDRTFASRGYAQKSAHPVPAQVGSKLRAVDPSRQAGALALWDEGQQPSGSPVEMYLASRGLAVPAAGGDVIRFLPSCPFAGERTPAMVALVRNIVTNAPQAIHRTALNLKGQKVEVNGKGRLALASIRNGAVKLTANEDVTTCLGIGEGIETTLSLQGLPEFGDTPVWSVLNAGGITSFPVLSGIECLWIAVDDDPAGRGASELCADRWRRAGREVFLVKATAEGDDINDALKAVAHG
ncbi:toprim domain-containing protein [Methylobacterium sp. E-046]|uniref:DUF7146 domain-containing protein n=1 Tax=Methylobacterium sp. E-046 TaxID=2836576 RepID=UPI001FB9E38F|nr:toprim domain-containing protein [Methylobacterium sp. E-046]MCJ2099366.1 toprim domain-containing protein [Methylobacterium sp. E-046]